MNSLCLEHVSEELLERYLVQQGSEGEEEVVETHLLICDACRERLDELEDYRSVMRQAFVLLVSEEEKWQVAVTPVQEAQRPRRAEPNENWNTPSWARGWLSGLRIWSLPRWSMIPAASVLALASILVIPAMRHAADPVHVSLSAERGSGTPAVAPPQGRNLQLHLDSSGLPDGEVSVEIVDSSGNAIGVQQALARANQVTIGVSHLASGLYYVRIRSGKEHRPDSDQLLREFAFQVR